MMRLFLNGMAASAGGGLTYLRNVLPHLCRRPEVCVTAAVSGPQRRELRSIPNLSLPEVEISGGVLQRFWREQTGLAALIRASGAQVLISTGNIALRSSPVPQILLSRNSLYTSATFSRDLRRRRDYGLWLDTRVKGMLARRSVVWADCTVAPTTAFAHELSQWTGRQVVAIHHGFDHDAFFADHTPLSAHVQEKLEERPGGLRLLYVSHYNYYRNFETLFRALPLIRQSLGGRGLRLFLTCRLRPGENPGTYRPQKASALVRDLGIADDLVELGAIPYSQLHQIYEACSVYVTPAYAESFSHPLVEAMACGLPVVAADSAVHREICGPAAVYFPHDSAVDLASTVCQIAGAEVMARELSQRGRERSKEFSWSRHVDQLLALAGNLLVTMDSTQPYAAA